MRRGMRYLLAGLVAAMAIGCGAQTAGKNTLSGKVTAHGRPVADVALVVTGPDGKTSGGTTNPEGVYLIPDPPKGQLQFHFIPAGPAKKSVPEKYVKPGNGLGLEYTGGKRTYDIELAQ
ncbi:MAG TPA: carboxypeptidase-like regulatory domain-containing protein [Gemmataceae bacterium]|nr:carboxypeptidase-like regulatory domain-containing protein [Gemmataceae bacterium]